MEVSGDESSGTGSNIELDDRTNQLLDQDPDHHNPHFPLDQFEFGSEGYCDNFKKALAIESKRRTKYKPFAWQLEVALNAHLGRDGFILAGTGSGKTLAMILLSFVDTRFRIFMISPLNALANAQVKQFEDWNLKAVAVNMTTRYKDLFKDIKKGRYQIIISSIEAFLDPTRLLPIVKSPELATLGPQMVVIDEAHCIIKWGPHFQPEYANIGRLKLLLTRDAPFIAATATANRLMQEAIKQSLRLGPDAFEINLGNRRLNLAYSVHRLRNVSTAAEEILDYFPSRTRIDGFTLIFVDSRKLGNQILFKLRQYFDPNLHGAIQLYHATRSEYDKEIMAAGFECNDGFSILICTEALTMGVDFRRVTLVIQVLAPTDAETLVQHTGRCGRNPADTTALGQAVVLVQDSLFEDSKASQKRLLKNMKKEDAPETTNPNPDQVA
ncbi:hypothetical protein FRC11_006937 [Ceratobasidium sp. 423]|nr:hypothetical protein FRC11_006937 [Ceratobasidium sp. 423]